MNLSNFLSALDQIEVLSFKTPAGKKIPAHVHITEVGKVSKHFIDCGGTERQEEKICFQLWSAQDKHHRLHAQKVKDIIDLSKRSLGLTDAPIEVEYQTDTVGRYGLRFDGNHFVLTPLYTDCLAKSECGVPDESKDNATQCCSPSGDCC